MRAEPPFLPAIWPLEDPKFYKYDGTARWKIPYPQTTWPMPPQPSSFGATIDDRYPDRQFDLVAMPESWVETLMEFSVSSR